jgi:hypothetical protein
MGGQIVFVGLLPALRRAGADAPNLVAASYNRIAWGALAPALVALLLGIVLADA